MVQLIVDIILNVLKSIPLMDEWFRQSTLQIEERGKRAVEEEHEENKATGRPSATFWKGRTP